MFRTMRGFSDRRRYEFNVNQALNYLKGNDQSIIEKFIEKWIKLLISKIMKKPVSIEIQISSLKVIQSHTVCGW